MSGDRDNLLHILAAVERIESYTEVGYQRYLSETVYQDAIIRRLEVIGEATKRLPKSLTDRYPQVNWTQIAKMRDLLIHHFQDVNLETVWNTALQYVPGLKSTVQQIMIDENL